MSPTNALLRAIVKRQDDGGGSIENDNNNDAWWWSPEAYAVKWGIIGAIFVTFLIFFFAAYFHAHSRMKKGLAPLPYHRWILRRSQRARFEQPPQNNFSFYRAQDGYAMNGYAPGPPAYNRDAEEVPAYTPPQGASKVNPSQNYAEIPPPGPPPSHSQEGRGAKGPDANITAPGATSTSYPQ